MSKCLGQGTEVRKGTRRTCCETRLSSSARGALSYPGLPNCVACPIIRLAWRTGTAQTARINYTVYIPPDGTDGIICINSRKNRLHIVTVTLCWFQWRQPRMHFS